MKKIIIFLLIIVVISLFFFLKETEKFVEIDNEGENINVVDAEGGVLFQYSIEEFREWAVDNWDHLFEEAPSFGEMREVDPNNFYRFHEGASIYSNLLAFSVSDYAAATDLSFIVIINIKNKEIRISEANNGSIDELLWSPDGKYIAYILHTARAVGDHLSLVRVGNMKRLFTISGDDVGRDTPRFEELKWREERVVFVSHGDRWSIDLSGEDLKLEESRVEGNLIINNPGIEENVWHLSYEEEGSSGMLLKLSITKETFCENEELCDMLLGKEESAIGRRVELFGVKEGNLFIVKEIK